jgi:hypothetical protein
LTQRGAEKLLASGAGVLLQGFRLGDFVFAHSLGHGGKIDRGTSTLSAAIKRGFGRPVLEIATQGVNEDRGVPELETVGATPVGARQEHQAG